MEQLFVELSRRGVKLRLEGDEIRVTAPSGALTGELRQALVLNKEQIVALLRAGQGSAAGQLPQVEPDAASRFEPFPLTEIQHAYWLGRDSGLDSGGVATHLYVELDCHGLDPRRLEDSLNRLIDRHDMLRAVVGGDGMQRVLREVPRYRIAVEDRSDATADEAERAVLATRDVLSHQVLQVDRWPLFDVRATLLPGDRLRLHVSLDLLILDAWSIFFFFKEWARVYDEPDADLPSLGLTFRDYVLAEQRLHESDAYRRAHAYWMERVDSLPPAPELPVRSDLSARHAPRFSRREGRLDAARWQKLKTAARDKGLTPSGLLLALYSEVLARWSTSPHFTLNVTVSNRLPVHSDVNHLIGDFTTLVMQEVDRREHRATFLEFARDLQKQFITDLEHNQVSGVAVMREWAKRRGVSLQAAMPVVFSSGLVWNGDEEPGNLEQFGKKVYSVSQTSQVWLDHHVMELQGELVFIWDAADAVFEDGVLDAMFSTYCGLIESIAGDDSLWNSRDVVALPAAMAERREAANRTAQPVPARRLHAGFVRQAQRDPGAVAVIAAGRTLTYGELLRESAAVADWLLARGVRPGHPVAVVSRKGWEQIVAVYGVLLAGGAYLPIDADLPSRRQLDLLRIGEAGQILTQPGALRDEVAAAGYEVLEIRPGAEGSFGPAHARSLEGPLDELAYVIFTSGTTGVPKGVMIDHQGAVNTIEYVNRLWSVGPADRVLGVSALNFDLSVYDVFGLHDAGGALVLPDYAKGHDPVHWRELIGRHGVTVWNSAPQLMRMLMDSFAGGEVEPAPLRTVLLSGDFIPLDLPDRVRTRYPGAEVVSLGGATEASIWSIYHPIGAVDPSWLSIPYGKPLPNQEIWVLDRALRPVPDHVKGRIHIGGIGLAVGYWRDEEKTAARFVRHPESGARLYDTGDLGRYAPDGNVVILGRDDGQIKIRGHRVELGEIEAVLRQHPAVRQAVVLAPATADGGRRLVAYLEPAAGAGEVDVAAVREHLGDRLPEYMVPRHIVVLDAIPVSANGKIDYAALPAPGEDEADDRAERVLPRDAVEQTVLDAWSRVIVGLEIGVTDNFFALGGDSVLATQLVRELNAELPDFGLEMHELFENLTIESLAALYRSRAADAAPAADADDSEHALLLGDLRAAVDGISAVDFAAGAERTARPGAVLVTGATGWVGSHLLAELLSRTGAAVYCLVRAQDEEEGRARVLDALLGHGIPVEPSWAERIRPVPGELTAPALGLDAETWRRLAESVDSIYHLAASVSVVTDYAAHSRVNVAPLVPLVRLAAEHHLKPLFYASPMTVCRRHLGGRLVVLGDERGHDDPAGLLTGYAQSKWVAEQVLLAAAARGLPVRVYRTSHALPSARTGRAKPADTYGGVLRAACAAGVVPEWADSRLPGVPVDVLGRLLVEDSLDADAAGAVVHLENRHPLSLESLLELLLRDEESGGDGAPRVSREEWQARCLEVADTLPDEDATLARVLFARRATGAGVDNMFAAHDLETAHFERRGRAAKLADLTPADYWRRVARAAGWAPAPSVHA